jgi:hypothetical protein
MRISSRVMTGAFSSMSIVRILFSLLIGFYRLRLLPGCIRQPARYYRDHLGARALELAAVWRRGHQPGILREFLRVVREIAADEAEGAH